MINIVIGNEDKKIRPQFPDCLKCAHFKVSWDVNFPRSCLVFELKSKELPSVAVFNATGKKCPAFSLKEGLT